jgi:hypothetical protein
VKRSFSELVSLTFGHLWRPRRVKTEEEEGQGLIELTFAVSLLAVIIVVSFEFALVFASYIALLNSARAGARYASTKTYLLLESATKDYESYCTPEREGEAFCEDYEMYLNQVGKEVWSSGLDQEGLTIDKPLTEMSEVGEPVIAGGEPVTVTLHYNLKTFTSGIRLPFFGRFGLPDTYRITASASFPIAGE